MSPILSRCMGAAAVASSFWENVCGVYHGLGLYGCFLVRD
uniref:Uncharacterized protein n=1 Tax=Arundo donax TaxID=35708 RepID=A0A0A8YZG4_ARUDO